MFARNFFLFTKDKLIADFISRVIPTVEQSLNTAKQPRSMPGHPARLIGYDWDRLSDVQDAALHRKVAS